MSISQRLARPLFAGIFIMGGLDSARNPAGKVEKADAVVPKITEPLGLSGDTATFVRVNGVAQLVAASAFALGVLPRLAAGTLFATLVPTTLAGHRFWEEDSAAARNAQELQFLKNLAIMGGLLLAMTGPRTSRRPGRPRTHR